MVDDDCRVDAAPNILHLEDAIVNHHQLGPQFIPDIGDRVVIEKNFRIGGKLFWLSTDVYLVKAIDTVSGRLELYNEACQNQALSNFKTGPSMGLVFKLPDSTGHGTKLWNRKKRT